MKKKGMTYVEALAKAREARPEIEPNDTFDAQLKVICGCAVVRLCGCAVVWLCGCVVVWLRGALLTHIPNANPSRQHQPSASSSASGV